MSPETPDDDFEALMETYTSPDAINAARKENRTSSEAHPGAKINDYPKYPQDEPLDLHTFTVKEALMRADAYIRASKGNGLRTIQIITGKGLHSENGKAKIRDAIRDRVIELKRQNIVHSFKWDQRREKSSGAIIVYLT